MSILYLISVLWLGLNLGFGMITSILLPKEPNQNKDLFSDPSKATPFIRWEFTKLLFLIYIMYIGLNCAYFFYICFYIYLFSLRSIIFRFVRSKLWIIKQTHTRTHTQNHKIYYTTYTQTRACASNRITDIIYYDVDLDENFKTF